MLSYFLNLLNRNVKSTINFLAAGKILKPTIRIQKDANFFEFDFSIFVRFEISPNFEPVTEISTALFLIACLAK